MENFTASLKEISSIIKKDMDIVEESGYILYSSNPDRVGLTIDEPVNDDTPSIGENHKLYIHAEGGSFEELGLCQLILKDKFYRGTADNYQQFLINILDGFDDVEEDSKKFGISAESDYVVYCVSLLKNDYFGDAHSLISNSFYGEDNIWVFPYKSDIVLLEKIDENYEGIYSKPRTIKDMMNSEMYTDIYVGVGNIKRNIAGIRRSFEEAKKAIEVGKVFNLPEHIYVFKNILPERVVNLVSEDKIEELLNEMFSENIDDILDGEMVKTIDVLFKNDLNISDSSRILYIHRNTLLYRLDKIQKATGLDIRRLEDAVTFKLIFLLKQRRKNGNKVNAKG